MFLTNGMKAKLIQYNRKDSESVFDDIIDNTVTIKCCPYNVDQGISYGIYTIPEATGYYQVPRWVDVREGDQIVFLGKKWEKNREITHTVLKVYDEWYFNRIENKVLAIK